MTKRITMISPIQGGVTYGLLTVAGSPYTVDDALAAELVNRRVASFTDPQLPTGADVALVVYFTQVQFALIAAGLRGVTYEVTDAAGSPQYRWNGIAFVQAGGGGGGVPNQTGTLAASATAAPVADTVIAALLGKQATLQSATNIKTVNGATLLGSGDLAIAGGVPNQTGTLAASATAAPVADTVIAALVSKATVGLVTYVDITASRALLATDIGKLLRNTTAGSLTITLAAVGAAGNVFATKHSGAGTLLVVTGGGVTAVDALGLAAAQATDAGAVMWEFDTTTRVLAS